MKMRKISVMLIFSILVNIVTFSSVSANPVQTHECLDTIGALATATEVSKLSLDLKSKMEKISDHDLLPVSVWLRQIEPDSEKIIQQAKQNVKKIQSHLNVIDTVANRNEFKSLISSTDNPENLDEYQLFIEAKRKIYENIYNQANRDVVGRILKNNSSIAHTQVTWISKYSPLIKMNLTKFQIEQLHKSPMVEAIYLDEHPIVIPEAELEVRSSANGTTSMKTWQQTTNISYVKSLGYTGSGVKVGLYDVGVLRYNDLPQQYKNVFSTLYNSGRLVADPSASTQDSSHAAYCGSIIAATNGNNLGIAPGVKLYSSTGANRVGQFEGAMEWLISQGVRIISLSVSWKGSHDTYDYISKWLDHIAIQHDVTTIKAAGNDGAAGISGGGMSYNSIAVGSSNDKNTVSRTDDAISSFSSYYTSSNSSLPMKPDLVAPGDNVQTPVGNNGGTSLSCPMVAGVTALLYQMRPSLEAYVK